MPIYLLIEGIAIGLVVAVPVGPLGLLCIHRALMLGPIYGLCSGLGIAAADAIAAGIAALGITLISGFLAEHQFLLRLLGGIFLCYLGYKILMVELLSRVPAKDFSVNGLVGAFATTFFLTLSNPVTILSFVAIYAGWHVPSLKGDYGAAATLTTGVFIGLTALHQKLSLRFLFWVHRVSGTVIAGFGIVVLLSLSPVKQSLGIQF